MAQVENNDLKLPNNQNDDKTTVTERLFADTYTPPPSTDGNKVEKSVPLPGSTTGPDGGAGTKPAEGSDDSVLDFADFKDPYASATKASKTDDLGRAITDGQVGKFRNTDNIQVLSTGSYTAQEHKISIFGEKDQRPMDNHQPGQTASAQVDRNGKLSSFEDSKGKISIDQQGVTISDTNGGTAHFSLLPEAPDGNLSDAEGDPKEQLQSLMEKGLLDTLPKESLQKLEQRMDAVKQAHSRLADMYDRLGMKDHAYAQKEFARQAYVPGPGSETSPLTK